MRIPFIFVKCKVISLVFAAGLSLWTISATAGPKITATLASVNTAEYINPKMQLLFIKKVKEKTNGGLDIQWVGSGQLGGLKENLEAIMAGNLEMCGVNNANLGPLFSETQLFDLPFIFRDYLVGGADESDCLVYWDFDPFGNNDFS